MEKKLFVAVVVLMLGVLVGIEKTGFAQEYEPDAFTLEAITVTAQKREQNLQDVATTIEAVSGTDLAEWGRTDLMDALSGISTTMVQSSGDSINISIRGMDNDGNPGDSMSMVAVTVDGAYSSAGVGMSGLYDMDRVEVLAGPQGTLYSRNSTGGVVNMVTKNPTDEYEASGSVEVGNYSLLNASGVLNAPLNDELSVRTAFNLTVRDGYHSNGSNDADTKSGRFKLKYDPIEKLSLVLGAELTYTGGSGGGNGVEIFEDAPDDPWTASEPGYMYKKDTKRNRYYLEGSWDMGGLGSLTLLPSVTEHDEFTVTPNENRDTGEYQLKTADKKTDETSVEVRLSSAEDFFLEYLLGYYYYTRTWDSYSITQDASTIQDQYVDEESIAVFGNLIVPVTDGYRLSLGGRYTMDDNYIYNHTFMNGEWGAVRIDGLDDSHFDYKIGMELDLVENIMLWADYSTGYRQAMKASQTNEYLDAYQVGMKSRFLDQRLQLNASAFYYDYTDYQVQIVSSIYDDEGEEIENRGSGIGDARLYGLDASSTLILTSRDRIDFSVSYLDAEISDLFVDFEETGPDYDTYKGGVLNNSPEWTIVGAYEHEFTLPNGAGLTAKANIRYQSDYKVAFFVEPSNIPDGMTEEGVNTQEAYTTTNLALNYGSPDGKMNVNFYVKNLEDYPVKVGFQMGSFRVNNPRTYGMVFSLRY